MELAETPEVNLVDCSLVSFQFLANYNPKLMQNIY